MKIAGMMRVKNEGRWIAEVIASLHPLVNCGIHILDDVSSDSTRAICRQAGAEVIPTPFNDLNEGRDKNYLLDRIRDDVRPDWIIQIDGDEILAEGSAEPILRMIETHSCDAIRFKIDYLWDHRQQIRTDGIYGRFFRGSAFRLCDGQRFSEGFHCSNVPTLGWSPRMCADKLGRLLHLGYLYREDRIRKYVWYRHMIAGDPLGLDVPAHLRHEVPAKTRTLHAGPLTLVPL
jgi:glycosyltransferase involved in cell wall biosynthesis